MSSTETNSPRHARARNHLQDGATRAAVRIFDVLLDERPKDPDLLNDAALAYAHNGDVTRAESCLRRALEVHPEHETAFYNLLDLLIKHRDDLAAREAFAQYASHLPNSKKKQYARLSSVRQSIPQQFAGLTVRVSKSQPPKKHLIIVAQPRSGSTIFWQTFRRDSRLTCYNEPFNSHLRNHFEANRDSSNSKSEAHNKTFTEFLSIPDLLRAHWSTIQPTEELYPNFIGHQIKYIQALLDTDKYVCIDFVRCNGKVNHLRDAFPNALIVHLIRDPRSWTTSHLRPYGEWIPGLPENFFCHDGWFNFWNRQRLAQHLNLTGYAHEKLLKIWHCLTQAAEKSEPDVTVQFEYFAQEPEQVLRTIYQFIDLSYTPINTSYIHSPNPPYAYNDPRWSDATQRHLSAQTRRFGYSFPGETDNRAA